MIYAVLSVAFVLIVYLFLSIKIVPQSQNFLIERLGKFDRKLEAGLHIVVPVFEAVSHRIDILERQLPPKKIEVAWRIWTVG